jgi:hypothetical protein
MQCTNINVKLTAVGATVSSSPGTGKTTGLAVGLATTGLVGATVAAALVGATVAAAFVGATVATGATVAVDPSLPA